MAWTSYQKMLAIVMVITGSINSLSTKWADKLESKGSDGVTRVFEHPFLQAAAMFVGEMLCLLTFKIIQLRSRGTEDNSLTRGNQNFNPFILMPAAMFDLDVVDPSVEGLLRCVVLYASWMPFLNLSSAADVGSVGTSIMYVGLTLTYVSSFQMFRGSVIIFVAVLSMAFLDRKLIPREWLGILSIILGLVVVGLTDAIYQPPADSKGPNSLITGDLLIIVAQVVTACQMVYEEKYVAGLNIPPLQAVGWEGVFGFSVLSVLLVVFYWIPAPPHFGNNARGTVEDVIDGLIQIGNNSFILLAILGTIVSIAFFNFAGISVTKEMSATTRMVLDSVRTFVIWMVSLALRWQAFHWPQLLGFGVLIYGMCEYTGAGVSQRCLRVLTRCCGRDRPESDSDESEVVNTDAGAEAGDSIP